MTKIYLTFGVIFVEETLQEVKKAIGNRKEGWVLLTPQKGCVCGGRVEIQVDRIDAIQGDPNEKPLVQMDENECPYIVKE